MPSRTPKQKKMMAALSHGWKPKKDRKKQPSNKVALDFHVKDYPSHLKKAFDVAWEVLKEPISPEDAEKWRKASMEEHMARQKNQEQREKEARERAAAKQLEQLISKPCPKCGAGIGVPCPNPTWGYQVHLDRMV